MADNMEPVVTARPGSPEEALQRLEARREREGRPRAAELFQDQKAAQLEEIQEQQAVLNGEDLAPEPALEEAADEEIGDDPVTEDPEAADAEPEDDLDIDIDPDEDIEESAPRDAPRGWREGPAKEVFATLDPDVQDEIIRRADAAEAEYDRRYGELRRTEETATQNANAIKASLDSATAYLKIMLNEDIPQEPAEALLDPSSPNYNPEQYQREMALHRRQVNRYNQRLQALQQMQGDLQRQATEKVEAEKAEAEKVLFREFPDWQKDDGREGQKQLEAIRRHLVDRGVDPNVAANLYDPTLIMIANDARKWRDYTAKRRDRDRRVKKDVKKVQAAGKGRRTGASKAQAQNLQKLQQRFKETGDLRDAAAYRKAKREASQRR